MINVLAGGAPEGPRPSWGPIHPAVASRSPFRDFSFITPPPGEFGCAIFPLSRLFILVIAIIKLGWLTTVFTTQFRLRDYCCPDRNFKVLVLLKFGDTLGYRIILRATLLFLIV